jgi:hypothetical protein
LEYQRNFDNFKHDQVLTDLMNTKSLISPQGKWSDREFCDVYGRRCIVGAIHKAVLGKDVGRDFRNIYALWINRRIQRVLSALVVTDTVYKTNNSNCREVLWLRLLRSTIMPRWAVVSIFNDSTNYSNVIKALDEAIDARLARLRQPSLMKRVFA